MSVRVRVHSPRNALVSASPPLGLSRGARGANVRSDKCDKRDFDLHVLDKLRMLTLDVALIWGSKADGDVTEAPCDLPESSL